MSNQLYGLTITGRISGAGVKERFPVQTVSLTNINLATTLVGVTVNGYTLITGDRVLLAGQTTGTENGIYITAAVPYRAADYESDDLSQSYVTVIAGTYARTTWQSTAPGIIGTSTQDFVMTKNFNYAVGGIEYANSAITRAVLAAPTGTAGLLQMTTAGVPSWLTASSRKVVTISASSTFQFSNTVNLDGVQGAASTNNLLSFIDSGAANYLTIANAASSGTPSINATGTDTNINLALTAKGAGGVSILGNASAPGLVAIYEQSTNGSEYIGLRAPASIAATTIFTLPNADGTSGQVLSTNGTGTLSFSSLTTGVSSVFGRTGAVTAAEGDYSLTQLSDVTITTPALDQILVYNGSGWVNAEPCIPMAEIGFCNVTTPYSLSLVTVNTYYKLAPVTILLANNSFFTAAKFDMPSNGRLRYLGAETVYVHVAVSISAFVNAASDNYRFAIYKNNIQQTDTFFSLDWTANSVYSSVAFHKICILATNDYLEVFVADLNSGTRVMTINNFNLVAVGCCPNT